MRFLPGDFEGDIPPCIAEVIEDPQESSNDLVVSELGCRFDGCNWRVECTVLWGDPLSRRALRDFVELITAEPQPESAAA